VTAAIFLTFLGSARLWDRDEPRNARAAEEMLERGDWIVPTFNGQLRSHKPILLYWMQMLAYEGLTQSEFTARLPSAFAAFISVLAIAWLASRLAGERNWLGSTGFWTGAALATSALFVMAGRAATPDSCLIACSTLGIASIVGGMLVPAAERSLLATTILRERLGWGWTVLGYSALGLAVLAKGPVGLILPLTIVHIWWLLVQRRRPDGVDPTRARWQRWLVRVWDTFHPRQCLRALVACRTLVGLLLATAVAAPWYVAVGRATDGAFLIEFFGQHNLGRALNSMEGHRGGPLFYPVALLIGTFPWSLWLIPIAWWGIKAQRRGVAARTSVTLAAVWMGVTISLFTLAGTKLPSYITSCYPGVALIVGGFLKDFANDIRMPSRGWRTLAGGVALFVATGLASGLIWFSFSEELPLVGWVGCSSILLAAAGVLGWLVDWQARPKWIPSVWLACAALLHIGLFGFGTSTVDSYRSELDMLMTIDSQVPAKRWFGVGGMEPSWVYYLHQPIQNLPESITQHLDQPEAWRELMQQAGIAPGDHLIVEGRTAELLTSAARNWPYAAAPLLERGRADRFLRSGEIVVYEFQPTLSQVAERPALELKK